MKNQCTYFKTLLLGLTVVLFFTNCSPEPEIFIQPDDIIGKWTAIEGTTEISYQGMSAYDYAVSQGSSHEEATLWVGYLTRGHGDYIPFSIEFKADGTLNSLSGAVGDDTGYPNEGIWKLSDNRKLLTFSGLDVAVITLTDSDLVLQFVFDSDEYSQELMTYDITLIYIKD